MEVIEHLWIEMPDGVRLAARLWLPEGGPHPAILEYIPYRKRDMVRARDERNHPYFAAHGYACLRVDMRGSGDSEGAMPDMYAPDELADARQVIDWIAAQPWCNGRVGMFGTSWGGTASLQAAVDAPGPLKAVIANCATIDRFEDDIHWMGGCLLTDGIEWGATLPAILAAPPDAATVGEGWFEMWQARLASLASPFGTWARNRTRGDYWRHGSVRFAAARLSCPILAIGGWSDRYSNSVLPLVRARPDLCWGIVGPWGHHYPDRGEPGPAIEFQDVALEWWDHWLKPDTPGAPPWPALRVWRRQFDPPQDRLQRRGGDWIALADPREAAPVRWHLGAGTLSEAPPRAPGILAVPFDLRHGECAGDTGYFGRVGGLPLDQSADDTRALCFDSAPLAAAADLLGSATLCLDVLADAMPAQIACRICDVAPDGRSNLVVRTVRNLDLDESLDSARPFRAGAPARYRIAFPTTAYRFARGHRIRLAIGASYWPLVWPVARPANLRVSTAAARLALPGAPEGAMALPVPFPEPKDLPHKAPWRIRSAGDLDRRFGTDSDGGLRFSWHQPRTTHRFDAMDLAISTETAADYRIPAQDPGRACCTISHAIEIRRPDGTATIDGRLEVRASGKTLRLAGETTARWNGAVIATRKAQAEV